MKKGDWLDELMDVLDGRVAATQEEAERIMMEHKMPSFDILIQKVKARAEAEMQQEQQSKQ